MPYDEQYYRHQLQSLPVLLVEDNKTTCLLMEALLSKYFQKVHVAYNGIEALDILQTTPIPFVITDINMPEMDGLTLSKQIHEHYPKTHIVIMSADSDTEIILISVNLGIDGYILKPINESSVANTVMRVGKILVNETLQEEYSHHLNALNTQLNEKIKALEEANARYEKMLKRFDIRIEQEFIKSRQQNKPTKKIDYDLEKIEPEHLDELLEIESEIDCFANLILMKKISPTSMNEIKDIGNKLFKYQSILKKYPHHLKISDSIADLARTLQQCDEDVKLEYIQESGPYFDSLFFMLFRFREEILSKLPHVKQPNMYDASMMADIAQIIMLLKGEHCDNEVEFF